MPGVQVHTNDGALAEPGGEARLVALVVEEAWGQQGRGEPCSLGAPQPRPPWGPHAPV